AEGPACLALLLRIQSRRRQGRRPASQQDGAGHQRDEPCRERAGGRQRQPLARGEPEQEPERTEAGEEEDPGGAAPEGLDRRSSVATDVIVLPRGATFSAAATSSAPTR